MTSSYHPENYWDTVAENISRRKELKIIAGDDEPYYRYKRRRFLALLGAINFTDNVVLEVGSGPGGNLDFIYKKGCRKLVGVDISQRMVLLAKELLTPKDIDIIKINGEDLPFKDNSFDIVFTSTVLQHNTEQKTLEKLVREMCRVSRDEILLFERVERKLTGHESNVGRPIHHYEALLKSQGFVLTEKHSLPIQVSYLVCGIIRKMFNQKARKEGEPLSQLSSRALCRLGISIPSAYNCC